MSTKNNVSYLLANKCRDYCRVKRLHHIYKHGINSISRILLRAPYAPLGKFERKQWKDLKGNLHTGLIFVRKKASNDKQLRGSYIHHWMTSLVRVVALERYTGGRGGLKQKVRRL